MMYDLRRFANEVMGVKGVRMRTDSPEFKFIADQAKKFNDMRMQALAAGPQVVADTLACYLDTLDRPFGERMLLALEAGQRAGGDKRGRQSAAIRIHTTEEYADLDLRVDDHEFPLVELRRLYEMSQGRPKIFRSFLATRANPAGVFDRGVIDAAIARWEAAQGPAAE